MISHPHKLKHHSGFTLLEVLVALLIVSVSLGLLIRVAGDSIHGTGNLRDSIIAQWIAENKASEIQLKILPISAGTLQGSTEMGKRTWYWRIAVAKTPDSYVTKVAVTVSKTRDHKSPVTQLVAFTLAY